MLSVLGLVVIFVAMYFVCGELERACGNLAHRLRIPESIAGATLLAVASSAPEFFTSFLGAVIHEVFDVGLIAILWSAIFNITVIPGVSTLVSPEPLKVHPTVLRRDCVAYAATTLLLFGLVGDGTLSTTDAAILLGAYGLYVYVLSLMLDADEPIEELEQPVWRTALGLLGGLAGIGVLCHFMIDLGGGLAEDAGISLLLVSALIFAPGTSIPDLLLSAFAARKGRGSAAVSNAFGSNSFDLTVCLAAPVFVVGDVAVDTEGPVRMSMWMLLGTIGLAMVLVRSGYRLARWEAYLLIGLFVALAGVLVGTSLSG
jgi:cation:H+ antiporter